MDIEKEGCPIRFIWRINLTSRTARCSAVSAIEEKEQNKYGEIPLFDPYAIIFHEVFSFLYPFHHESLVRQRDWTMQFMVLHSATEIEVLAWR